MTRPRGKKSIMRTPEEKETIVLEYLNGNIGRNNIADKYQVSRRLFQIWICKYRENGVTGLKSQTGKKTGGTKGQGARKPKTKEEELQRKIMKLEIENERLKKGYTVKGVGDKKEYVTIFEKNTK